MQKYSSGSKTPKETIKGTTGELYVMYRLYSWGLEPELALSQKRYDLWVETELGIVRVQVKSAKPGVVKSSYAFLVNNCALDRRFDYDVIAFVSLDKECVLFDVMPDNNNQVRRIRFEEFAREKERTTWDQALQKIFTSRTHASS